MIIVVAIQDLQRLWQRRFPQIPVLLVIKLAQFLDQSWNVDIVVVIKVTKPPANKRILFRNATDKKLCFILLRTKIILLGSFVCMIIFHSS